MNERERVEYERQRTVEEMRRRLSRGSAPRAEMGVIVFITAAAGLVSSYAMLRMGLTSMAVRYPLAVMAAYGVFLGLLRLWLSRHHRRVRSGDRGLDWSDLDLPDDIPLPSGRGASPVEFGGGGGGGGGGSTRVFGEPGPIPLPSASSSAGSSSAGGGGWGLDLDLDEGAWVIIPALILGALACGAIVYVIYAAPALFAELVLDGALAAGLYRRLRTAGSGDWLRSALRRTWLPALAVALLLSAAGAILQHAYPGAASIGRVWERVTRRGGDARG